MEPCHPDDLPFVHGRDIVPLRQHAPRFPNHRRARLLAAEDELRRQITRLDQVLIDAAAERRELLQQIQRLHDQLRPCYTGARGRRQRAVTLEEPLPPIAQRPTWLCGRALRAVCLAFLRRARRALTLRQLHVLLHRAGYAIASALPGKTLADALGHETDVGRAERVARATYTIAGGHRAQGDDDNDRADDPPSTLPDR